jgi:hypothetical protein
MERFSNRAAGAQTTGKQCLYWRIEDWSIPVASRFVSYKVAEKVMNLNWEQ